jgi:hypothetical protein
MRQIRRSPHNVHQRHLLNGRAAYFIIAGMGISFIISA